LFRSHYSNDVSFVLKWCPNSPKWLPTDIGHVTDRLGVSLYFFMLPRHFKGIASARALRPHLVAAHNGPRLHPNVFVAQFHASRYNRNEVPKSPFQTFVDVLKDELRKNRELQENVKQLQGDVDKLQDSEAMKRARAAYERARVRSEIPSFIETSCQVTNEHDSSRLA
jgi:hypothetical protein